MSRETTNNLLFAVIVIEIFLDIVFIKTVVPGVYISTIFFVILLGFRTKPNHKSLYKISILFFIGMSFGILFIGNQSVVVEKFAIWFYIFFLGTVVLGIKKGKKSGKKVTK